MPNILVTANYNLINKNLGPNQFEFEKYREITNLCVESYKRNLAELDEVILLEGNASNYHRMFEAIFYKTTEIYKTKDCNMIWTDSDCICVKPTEIFGKYDYFVMFDSQDVFCAYNSIDPKCYAHLKPWMMSNIRYYPRGKITEKIWEAAYCVAEEWKDVWAYECIIYNAMFHAQGFSKEQINRLINPLLNCQYQRGQTDWGIMEKAHIIHVQSSRNRDIAIDKMRTLLAGNYTMQELRGKDK